MLKLPAVNDEVLNRLISENGDSILRMCYLYLKDYYLAEDAMQETFLSVYRNYDKFEHKSTEKTWIIRIAMNQCKSIMRKKYFQMEREQLSVDKLDSKEITFLIEDTFVSDEVIKLPIKEREVILAYYYQELSVKETADVLGIKEAAVMQRLKRGRERLKKVLKGKIRL